MKIIKIGKPHRIHKCSKCKSIYAYSVHEETTFGLVYCPVCRNYLDCHLFDRKISVKKYNELKDSDIK